MDKALERLITYLNTAKEPKRVLFASRFRSAQTLNMREFFKGVPGSTIHPPKKEITYKGHTILFRDFENERDTEYLRGYKLNAVYEDDTLSDPAIMAQLSMLVRP